MPLLRERVSTSKRLKVTPVALKFSSLASNSRFAEKSKELERAAQIMFYVGCCLLPWVWCLSIIYFWKIYNSETCPAGVKMYIKQSIQGLILVTLLFSVWVVVFQTNKLSSWAHPLLIVPQNDGW